MSQTHANACADFQPGEQLRLSSGVVLNYETVGHGAANVIYVHGIGASLREWDDIRSHLAPNFRHWFVDIRGHGHSSKPADGPYTLQAHATDLAEFVTAQNLQSVVLLGHSYGGPIVLLALRELQSRDEAWRLKGLILVDSAGYAEGDAYPLNHLRVPIWGKVVTTLLSPRFQAQNTLKLAFHDDTKISSRILNRYICPYSFPNFRRALLLTARQAVPADADKIRDWFSSIALPTLIIWGKEDRMIPLSDGHQFSRAIANSRMAILDSVGHIPHEEAPVLFAEELQEFLLSLPDGDR